MAKDLDLTETDCPRPLGPAAALFASYFLLAVLGLRWATAGRAASPAFPAAGVALAGLLLGGPRLWPAVFAGTMAAFLLEAPSLPLWAKAALASGNTLAALSGAWALRRARLRPALTRLTDVLGVSAAALGTSAVSATAGTFALAGALDQGSRQALVAWLDRWAGDVTGVIVVAPLVLSWARGEPVGRARGRWLHLALCTAAASALAWLSFGPESSRMIRPWVTFPALTWAALTWGVRGATAAMLPVAAIAVEATTEGHGPFGTPAALQFALLQQFIGATAVTTLVLAVFADERCERAGNDLVMLGVIRDIAERKRAEEALRENEARLRLALRAGQTGVWEWDVATGRVVWSDEVCGIFGIPPGTFEGTLEAFERRIYPDDRARVRAETEAAIKGRAGYAIEFRVVRPDGQVRWVTDLGTVEYDEAGQPRSMIGMVTDITEKRAAADALRESEERFRNIADNSPVMIWVTRPDACCIYLNKVWSDFTGQAQAAGLGFGWLDMLHPEDAERSASIFRAANARREPFRFDYRLRRRDGQYRWCIDAAAPRFSPSGEFLGYVGSVIDITDRKEAEEERARLLEVEQAARSEAERANRLKDEFLSTVSHELRTPLTAILGWTHLLRRRVSCEDEDLCKGLAVIDRNARAQAQLIEDLLDMGRITSGKIHLDVQPLDLHDVVGTAVSSVTPSAAAKGIRLEKISSPAVGLTRGDPNRLQQVVWNLLSNAIKFTPAGGSVQVKVSRAGDHVEITISDTGEGIKPEFLPHVFERFRQADASTTRRHGGLGLGLAIVKHLVELHGGAVRATSAGVGKGATFTVELPLDVAHAPAGGAMNGREVNARASGDDACELSDLSGISVLFVDDAPDTRDMVRTFVEERKARVRLAGSAEEALRLLELERPDVLVSDIGMRGMDGYELIRRVRALPRERGGDVPAVALTAYAGNEDRTRALLAGFQTHLAKPVQPTELMAAIGVLAARGARKGRPQAGDGGQPLP
ncbi:PAS domain S-box protein [Sorangium sp. So ce1389]|uniref:PAS domain S-box protein n=1 Tax=Sorangium sp. So ce1389 TaxID=3133336 RepID=UPI003F61D887